MPQLATRTPKAARTRSAILAAAERLFADHGFDGTRLEDVATSVGIRRASIVYYYRDKGELYDAVLADVLGGLRERIEPPLTRPGPLLPRIEAAVSAWVEYVGGRPTLARLLLREVADAGPGVAPRIRAHTSPFVKLARQLVSAGRDDPLLARSSVAPAHVASTIAGATVFFVAALPALSPDPDFDPLSPEQIAVHQQQILQITRRLLGAETSKGSRRPSSPEGERR